VFDALKHGVRKVDMLHAFARYRSAFEVGDGMMMFVGPATTGQVDLEVGVVETDDGSGDILIVHAMRARPKFLNPNRRRR
jgi:hypothetical protein